MGSGRDGRLGLPLKRGKRKEGRGAGDGRKGEGRAGQGRGRVSGFLLSRPGNPSQST